MFHKKEYFQKREENMEKDVKKTKNTFQQKLSHIFLKIMKRKKTRRYKNINEPSINILYPFSNFI